MRSSLAVLLTLAAAQLNAQSRTVWDGVYSEAQAARGTMIFGQSCAGCHSLTPEGRSPVVGEVFWKNFAQKNVADLLEFVTANMPNGKPKSLSKAAYEDVVAVMLKSNGFPSGANELASENLAKVQIVTRDGRTELPANALVRVVGCLTKSGTDWAVTQATTPERAERVVAAGEDAARPLGNRTMPLKFVLTRLDPLAGARVLVNGLLIGADGVDGINVTSVSRVAQTCP
ncbi:MAG: cytochrome c [Bryobacteraceae bacterium]